MIALLYQNFYLRDLISLIHRHVKDLFGDFWKSPEISDYTDYEEITPIRNTLKKKRNPCLPAGRCEIIFPNPFLR